MNGAVTPIAPRPRAVTGIQLTSTTTAHTLFRRRIPSVAETARPLSEFEASYRLISRIQNPKPTADEEAFL